MLRKLKIDLMKLEEHSHNHKTIIFITRVKIKIKTYVKKNNSISKHLIISIILLEYNVINTKIIHNNNLTKLPNIILKTTNKKLTKLNIATLLLGLLNNKKISNLTKVKIIKINQIHNHLTHNHLKTNVIINKIKMLTTFNRSNLIIFLTTQTVGNLSNQKLTSTSNPNLNLNLNPNSKINFLQILLDNKPHLLTIPLIQFKLQSNITVP